MVGVAVAFFALSLMIGPRFYPPVFRWAGNSFFGDFGSHRIVRFEPFDDPLGISDTRISIGTDATGARSWASSLGVNSVREAYAPAAGLLALLLATPMDWRRRWRAAALGLAVVHAFIALRIIVACLYGFSRIGMGEEHLLEVGRTATWALRRADQIVSGDLHLTYIVPILTWLILAAPTGAATLLGATGPVHQDPQVQHVPCDERARSSSKPVARR
jgi:hypothetical protein